MAGGISLHAVDVASGRPAEGMAVELHALQPVARLIARGNLGSGGALQHAVVQGQDVEIGTHEAHFFVGDWMRAQGLATGPIFMEVAVFRFQVRDLKEHYHLPLKFTAWGFALFRGS
jgi:5-hydroxyisourate hydrolase